MSALERPGNPLACPNCLSPAFIGENVTGWREIKGVRMTAHGVLVDVEPFETVADPAHESFFCSNPDAGCDPDRDIPTSRLVQLGNDGKPLEPQPAEQQAIAGVA